MTLDVNMKVNHECSFNSLSKIKKNLYMIHVLLNEFKNENHENKIPF